MADRSYAAASGAASTAGTGSGSQIPPSTNPGTSNAKPKLHNLVCVNPDYKAMPNMKESTFSDSEARKRMGLGRNPQTSTTSISRTQFFDP